MANSDRKVQKMCNSISRL